ncbi:MAG TPA: RdgB/HAM1 family non-canonical purine NTP pyrophosphatase [Steroidobacteraceae bacterium]|jgi:XTP/dITP diphosphohydrolase|nr:RdgB/HAM1 family non-canonical purine NTP pyrophosphatase [Steroidobacteraceae bacterium]
MRVVLATANRGKQRELAALLAPLGLELDLAADLGIASPEETGATFEANALLKARHASRLAALPALADDSGLEVDALGGRPGVHSARYAGPGASDADNNARLLAELADCPAARRSARYRCVLALVRDTDDPAPLLAHGRWDGHIALASAGAGGFGYDPLFIPQGYEQTVAELPAMLKQQHSHRASAAASLAAQLRAGALSGTKSR